MLTCVSSTSPSAGCLTGAGGATGAMALAEVCTRVAVDGSCAACSGRPLTPGCSGRAPPADGGDWTADAAEALGNPGCCGAEPVDGRVGTRSRVGAVAATAAAAPVTPESPGDTAVESAGLPFFAWTSCSGEVTALCTRCAASLVACAARDACARSAAATSYAVDAFVVDRAPLPDGDEARVASSGPFASAGAP